MIKVKTKSIFSGGKVFLRRLSIYLKKGSIKIHLITNDDADEHHSHPWDFKSLILFGGYWESVIKDTGDNWITTTYSKYPFLSVNRKLHNEKHKTKLLRLWGIKIPALTVGIYSEKIELCSFCKELGYCKLQGPKLLEKMVK